MSSDAPNSLPPGLRDGADIGQALKAVREFKGLSLEEVAELTRVRRAYLVAIEELRLDALPSRPFTIGYIRAYATALGLDPEAAVQRFRSDEPELDEPLRAPVGVSHDRDPRMGAVVVGICLLLGAIILWNVAQRAMSAGAPPPAAASEATAAHALEATKAGPVSLGAPLPAPVESTTPTPYETPGLAHVLVREDGVTTLDGTPKPADRLTPPAAGPALPATFTPKGQVYGAAPAQASPFIIQAIKPGSVIVRGADGTVYFARQLSVGEAYRAPNIGSLVIDVSEPKDFQVFAYGQSRGLMPAAQMQVGKLGG